MTDPERRPGAKSDQAARRPQDIDKPVRPGGIDRDIPDPVTFDPYGDPRLSGERGLGGAAIALALIVLGVLALAIFGGGSDEADQIAGQAQPAAQSTDGTTTGSISPDAEIPPIEPKDPAEPLVTAPAD